MYSERLRSGDEIRVIAPSRSLSAIKEPVYEAALAYLREKGYSVTFARHSREVDNAESASIEARVEDLHEAFSDTKVKAILTAIGGFNVNQILDSIDYSIIKNNPKVICGYSDTTALLHAIYAKTGLVTYHGPHFCSFGSEEGREYTYDSFEKCVMTPDAYEVGPSVEAGAYTVIQEGSCEGTILGGNLCTLNLLQGTAFMPQMQDVILFLEDDNIMGDYFVPEFERNLQSLLQQKEIRVKGVVFGRFADNCRLGVDTIRQLVKNKWQLKNIPIVFHVDFGHVFPQMTFPIGGVAELTAKAAEVQIIIDKH